jgi:hypothetical protein
MAVDFEQVLMALRAPSASLQSVLTGLKDQLSPHTAEQGRRQLNATTDANTARIIGTVAGAIYIVLGNRRGALQMRFETANRLFMLTEDRVEYLKLHSEFLQIAGDGKDEAEVYFAAVSAAAECLYFARQVTQDDRVRHSMLLETLKFLSVAAVAAQPAYTHLFLRFLSLLGSTLQAVFAEAWSGVETAYSGALLHGIAGEIEAKVPVERRLGSGLEWLSYAKTFAQLSFQHGSADVATRRLGAAVDLTRGDFRSRAGRLWCAQTANLVLAGLVGQAMDSGRTSPTHLFAAAELLKARLLLDQLGGAEESLPSDPRVLELERDILRFKPSKHDAADEDAQSTAEWRLTSQLPAGWTFDDRKQMVDSLEAGYARANVGLQGVAPVASLVEIQAALGPHEALIEYFIPAHATHPAKELLAIATTATEVDAVPLPLDALGAGMGMIGSISFDGREPLAVSPLGEAVWSMRRALLEADDELADQWLQKLWLILVFPLLNRWGYPDESKRWIIVPHGPLHYVPFAALREPSGTRLVEDVALTVAPSASAWLALRRRPRSELTRFFGIADPLLEDSDLPRLEQAHKELSTAMKACADLETQGLSDERATERAVRDAVRGAGIVHIAAHGDFPEQDPLDFHRILLAADNEHDGKLHADEVRDMDLTATHLVVLSICDGGLYRFGPGDEPLGLVPALFAAGAANVFAPLWEIEDTAARRFTRAFYKELLKQGPAEAWRRACKRAIKEGTSLRDWAGFVNTGSGAPFSLPKPARAGGRKPRRRAMSHRPRRAPPRAPR